MALLPKSLLPVKFGGDGDGTEDPEDFQQDVTGAQIRDQYSPFKKRKGKDDLKREAAKQQADAQFLDGLFGDNLSDDSNRQEEVREDQYNQLKDQITHNPDYANDFLNNLALPEYQPDENPEDIKN